MNERMRKKERMTKERGERVRDGDRDRDRDRDRDKDRDRDRETETNTERERERERERALAMHPTGLPRFPSNIKRKTTETWPKR